MIPVEWEKAVNLCVQDLLNLQMQISAIYGKSYRYIQWHSKPSMENKENFIASKTYDNLLG